MSGEEEYRCQVIFKASTSEVCASLGQTGQRELTVGRGRLKLVGLGRLKVAKESLVEGIPSKLSAHGRSRLPLSEQHVGNGSMQLV